MSLVTRIWDGHPFHLYGGIPPGHIDCVPMALSEWATSRYPHRLLAPGRPVLAACNPHVYADSSTLGVSVPRLAIGPKPADGPSLDLGGEPMGWITVRQSGASKIFDADILMLFRSRQQSPSIRISRPSQPPGGMAS